MSKHTPGPWTVENGEGDADGGLIVASENECICVLQRNEFTGLDDKVNGQLIAAAPELLEVLQVARVMLAIEAHFHRDNQQPKKAEPVESFIATIDAAIAKATEG